MDTERSRGYQDKVRNMFIGLAWVAGLLLAGSDGPWMPWGNAAGIVLFWGACAMMGRRMAGAKAGVQEAPGEKEAGPEPLRGFCVYQGDQNREFDGKLGRDLGRNLGLGMALGLVQRQGFK